MSLMFLLHFDVFCDPLLDRHTATWNLLVSAVFTQDRKLSKTLTQRVGYDRAKTQRGEVRERQINS